MIDTNRYYLGSICKRKHEYETSGKGLRYLNSYGCIKCSSENAKKHRQSEKAKAHQKEYGQSEKAKAYQKGYRQSEKGKAVLKNYRQSDKGKVSAKRGRQSDKGKAARKRRRQSDKSKEWYKKQIIEHTQYAIRSLIRSHVRRGLNSTKTGKTKSCEELDIDPYTISKYIGPHPNTLGIKGKFHLHHKVPLSLFDLGNLEHIKVAFDSLNHQWLSAEENFKKSNKLPKRCDVPKTLLKKLKNVGLEI